MNENELPTVPLDNLCRAIANPLRWRIIRELCRGEPLPVAEVARRLEVSGDVASKHLAILREQGVAEPAYGSLTRIAPAFQPKPGETVLDLGHCVIRLDTPL